MSTRTQPGTDAPEQPRDLHAVGTETGIVLSWSQRGTVDYWGVYCDQLDGSDVLVQYALRPACRVEDLAPGDHHIEVAAWRNGVHSDSTSASVAVLGRQPGHPHVPVITTTTVGRDTVGFEWISRDAEAWEVRLLNDRDVTLRERVALPRGAQPRPRDAFDELAPRTRYGLQVRARNEEGRWSPWCPPQWIDTEA